MQKISNLFLLIAVLAFAGCEKEISRPDDNYDPTLIDFQNPTVGQTNYYLGYTGQCGNVTLTGDTLVLRIAEIKSDSLFFEEDFTPGSNSARLEPLKFGAKWSKDMLEMAPETRQSSSLLYFYGSDSLRLTQSPVKTLKQENCLVWDGSLTFTGDYIGKVDQFKVGVSTFKDKKIVSCVPVIFGLDGYLVYDRHNLYTSFTSSLSTCCGAPPPTNPNVQAFALLTAK